MIMKMTAIQSETAFLDKLQQTTLAGDYQLDTVLGEGRFGIVYKAMNTNTGEDVAIKFLKVWSVPEHARQNLIRRFELEFETGQIKSDFLIRSIEMNQLDGIPYFVMEYCDGGNLERKLNKGLSTSEALKIAEGMLSGLNDLHKNGKIHRDLKPENVLFDSDGNPKLTDFGISGHINIQLTIVNQDDRPEQIFGSYAYMAPEQLSPSKRKNTLLPTIDIFSFGVVCFELFTGHLPFGPWENHDDIDPYIRRAARGDHDEIPASGSIPAIWISVLKKCLVSDRENRFQNIEEITGQLFGNNNTKYQKPCGDSFSMLILDGEEYGSRLQIHLQNFAGIGRSSTTILNEISVKETISNYISRRHATFELIDGSVYLRDGQWNEIQQQWVTSKNGTYVNGILIDSREGHQLYCNDVITVGNTSIKIY